MQRLHYTLHEKIPLFQQLMQTQYGSNKMKTFVRRAFHFNNRKTVSNSVHHCVPEEEKDVQHLSSPVKICPVSLNNSVRSFSGDRCFCLSVCLPEIYLQPPPCIYVYNNWCTTTTTIWFPDLEYMAVECRPIHSIFHQSLLLSLWLPYVSHRMLMQMQPSATSTTPLAFNRTPIQKQLML